MTDDGWDDAYDVVAVGSGAAGLTAAITAADSGQSTLVVEKEAVWGGTTGYAGGALWIPNHFRMEEAGLDDSIEDALAYLEATVGDLGPATSLARKQAFLQHANEMVLFLKRCGFEWGYSPMYPDFYPDAPGARSGRSLDPGLFDGKQLGEWEKTLIPTAMPRVAIRSFDEIRSLQIAKRTPRALGHTLRLFARTAAWRARGRVPLAAGQALVAKLMYILQTSYQVPVWLETPLRDLVVEGDRVVGVVVERHGRPQRIRARNGVLLGAGGFAKDGAFRRQYQPVGGEWTSAAPGDTGDAIKIGKAAGAELALMENAWWGPSFQIDGAMSLSVFERSLPGCLMVDQLGRRFVNESTSFVDIARAMLQRDREDGTGVPSWLVMDATHRKRYMLGMFPGGITPRRLIDDGTFVKAQSLDDLAKQCQMDAAQLHDTVKRFNSFARHGIDEDFHRGDNIYDRYYSDPTVRPNPTLAPVENAPFWAARLYPGDAGTMGGLLTDEYARVVREDGSPIAGLYAAGNTSASVMGRLYVGPGSTIAPAATFAYIAMRHAASAGTGQ